MFARLQFRTASTVSSDQEINIITGSTSAFELLATKNVFRDKRIFKVKICIVITEELLR